VHRPALEAEGRPLRVIIAGGWTGGHLFTALAITEALRRRAPGVEVRLGGTRGGMEIALGRGAGLPVETVWLDGVARGSNGRSVVRNAALPLKLAVALWQARRIVARFRPDVAVGVGAYVSFPIVAVAEWLGIPTLLHEANAVPGLANGLLARGADVVCLGLAEAAPRFTHALERGWVWRRGEGGRLPGRVVHTGTPVRPEVAGARGLVAADARAELGLDPSAQTILVMGGSLGSGALNAWMLSEGHRLAVSGGRQVLWQCGRAHFARCRARLDQVAGVHLVPFLHDMRAAYAAADLVVAGAGAGTLAELAELGKPAIIVPDRGVSEDHQVHNAEPLGRAGVPVWTGTDRPGAALTTWVRALADDPARLDAAGAALARLAHPGAADAIAEEIVTLGQRRPGGRGSSRS
jgi:UDP-N-acetylglucosamine--N-acetylmuramyl-(pentapeptide) pyrophosphoryl-undecaprenol N-acetylglucosamine transferase